MDTYTTQNAPHTILLTTFQTNSRSKSVELVLSNQLQCTVMSATMKHAQEQIQLRHYY